MAKVLNHLNSLNYSTHFFTTKRDQGGSGLGTHIVFNLVKQTLSGDIEVSSNLGEGLTYDISFPKNMPTPMSIFTE